jgi:putative ATPase
MSELFEKAGGGDSRPLADRMRPSTMDDLVGQQELVGQGGMLADLVKAGKLPSMLLWGPPGCGKTTLAFIIASTMGMEFVPFSAVLGGVKEVRQIVATAQQRLESSGRPTVLFVDEIHRFNKAQQDAFLPHVERGTVVLLGATTENPSFEVNPALLSRVTVARLFPLSIEDLGRVLARAVEAPEGLAGEVDVTSEAIGVMAELADSDARRGLNLLEQAAWVAQRREQAINAELVKEVFEKQPLAHDRAGDHHYDVASAFIKSLRGSDPDAALYWMLRMVEAGDDPVFVARRMVIFAAEDVGNADPQALGIATHCFNAVRSIGLPECKIPMAQAATYLATAPKSNAAYMALKKAEKEVSNRGSLPVPMHLRNAPTSLLKEMGAGKGYNYPHDFPGGYVPEQYKPDEIQGATYYKPKKIGYEKQIRQMMQWRKEQDEK